MVRDGPDYELVKCSSRENPYLPGEFVRDLEESYAGAFARQEIDGEFVAAEGRVYTDFSREIHVREIPEDKQFEVALGGVDWGFTNPAVVLAVGVDSDNRLWVLDEFYKRRVLLEEQIAAAREFSERYGVSCFYCDPSEPANIAAFHNAGLLAQAGNNALLPGIAAVSALLPVREDGLPRLIVSPRCANLIVEFEQYRYPEDKGKSIEKEQPIKAFDHALDALRYVAMALQQSVARAGIRWL